jgi:peptidoglycan-associated lipoprotein
MKKNTCFSLLIVLVILLTLSACSKKPVPVATQLPPGETAVIAEASMGESGAPANTGLKLDHIFFEYDSFSLTPESRDILARNAEWLLQNPTVKLTIEGHCDGRGSDEYNLALGEKRSDAVKKYLTTLGVGSERLFSISYGEERPAVVGQGEGAWAQNRRAEFM